MDRRDALMTAMSGPVALAAATFFGLPALAETAAPGPVLAVISHPVADYAAWHVVYEEAAPIREAAGVTGAEVFVDAAAPDMVVIIHRFVSVESAQAFLSNPGLAEAMQRGGVTAPPTVTLAMAA